MASRETTRFHTRLAWVAVLALATALFGMSNATAQSAADDPAQIDAGRTVYEMACAGCHGDNGEGSSLGRPLTDIALQEPDRSVHIMSVTDGKGPMPALGARLDAEQIDAAVSFVRLTFVSEEAADAEPEALADTGLESTAMLIVGATLLAGGGLLVTASRRFSHD